MLNSENLLFNVVLRESCIAFNYHNDPVNLIVNLMHYLESYFKRHIVYYIFKNV